MALLLLLAAWAVIFTGSTLPGGSQRLCWWWRLFWQPLGCHEMARLARQRAEWQGFAAPARPGWSGSARQAWCGRRGRYSQELARQAWPGQVGTAKPGGHGRHGFEGLVEDWTGQARQAWLRKARPGQFWQARRGQAWKVRHGWLGVVGLGQGTAGKASWAPMAGHGRRGNKGMAGSGVAGCCRHR
jgi:hypothetical protein